MLKRQSQDSLRMACSFGGAASRSVLVMLRMGTRVMRLGLCVIGDTQDWNALSGLTFGR